MDSLGRLLLSLLQVPAAPAPPDGTPGTLRVFRASNRWVNYQFAKWAGSHALFFFGLAFAPVALMLAEGAAAWKEGVWTPEQMLLGLGLITLVVGWLLFFVIGWAAIRISRDTRWYMVTDRCIRIRQGVWLVREMTLDFGNIQNVSVSQGPLQRAFGIADVKIQTAGGGGGQHEAAGEGLHTGFFRGLGSAASVRNFVVERMKAAQNDGLGRRTSAVMDGAVTRSRRDRKNAVEALRMVALEAKRLKQATEQAHDRPHKEEEARCKPAR